MVLDNLSLSEGLLHLRKTNDQTRREGSGATVSASCGKNNEDCARYISPRAGQIAASALVVDKGRSPGGRTRVVPAQLLPPSTLHARTRRMLRVFLCCRDDGIYCRRVYLASVDPPTSALPKKAEYTEHSSLPSG